MSDPRDAPYAVGFADASLRQLASRGRFRPFHLLLAILVLVELIVTRSWRPAALLPPALGFAFLRLHALVLRRKIAAGRLANAELEPAPGADPDSRASPARAGRRRPVLVSLVAVLVVLVSLTVTATIAAIAHTGYWTAAANRICAREQAQLAVPRMQWVDARGSERRRIRIEQQALAALQRLTPAARRTRLQRQFLAWREYEVGLDEWLVEALSRSDSRAAAEVLERVKAHERAQELARRVGASTCARV